MTLTEALRIALRGLVANRLRSGLTMLGILIGVAAVIMLVAFGNGATAQITGQIEGLGSNLITVFPGAQATQGVSQGFGSGQTLTERDLDALADTSQAPDVALVMPLANGNGILQFRNDNWQTPIAASTHDYPVALDLELSVGAFFTESDVRSRSKVVVLGQTPVDELFGGDPVAALGQTIKIERQSFRVVGVLGVQGSTFGVNADNTAVMPITTAWSYLLGGAGENINQIVIQATNSASVEAAQAEVTQVLLNTHGLTDPSEADFQVLSQQEILAQVQTVTAILTAFLGAIAAISLLVGGIGVMNIMLVTVTERTREIGIRKAIGAKRRAILLQFLIESMVLSGIGGVIGVLIGVGFSLAAAAAANRFGGGNFPAPVVSLRSVVMAFVVSVSIGLFFGVYPANRAARLRPIEALRHQ